MKAKEKKELHEKTEEELGQLIRQAKEELLRLNIEKSQKKLKNTSSVLQKRKNLAIMQTILNEKRFTHENV